MADNKIEIKITADNRQAVAAMGEAARAMGVVAQKVEVAKVKIGDMAKAVALGQAAFVALAKAAGSIFVGLPTAAIREAVEQESRYKKLEAVVRATGQAAGYSAEQVRAMSYELAQATLGSTQEFENAAAVLMTFRQVHGETFRRALELSKDLAEVMGGDAASAAMQLGKALEDPDQGLSALTRSGVSFSDAQKQVIKDLMESGRVAEAHAMILDAVAGQVGGTARAMADSTAGALDSLSQAWEDLRKVIGEYFKPAFEAAVRATTSGVQWMTNGFAEVEKFGAAMAAGLLKAWARIEYGWNRIKAIFGSGSADAARAAMEKEIAAIDAWVVERFREIEARYARKKDEVGAPSPRAPSAPTTGAPKRGKDKNATAARLAMLKAEAEAEFALLKDSLERQKRELDASLEDRLVSIRDYYAKKTAIEQQAIDAERASREKELAAARAIVASQKAGEAERTRALGEVKRLEAEIEILNRRRADVAADNARRQAAAERELAGELARVRERLAEIKGGAGGDVTRARIEREWQPFIEKLQRMGDEAGAADVVRLINVEADLAELSRLERQYQAVMERMAIRERELQVQKDAGMLTEMQLRREVLTLHQQTAAEVEGLIPKMQELAAATGSEEAINRVARMKVEIAGLKTEIDDIATRINGDVQNAFVSMFEAIGSGAKSAKDAFRDFARAVIASLQRIAAQKLAEQIFGSFGKGGGIGAFFSNIFKFASGGPVPGSGDRDTVPALLTPGEFVIRRDAVRRVGLDLLHAINGGGWIPRLNMGRLAFASGGLVPSAQVQPAQPQVIVHNHFSVQGPVTKQSEYQISAAAALGVSRAIRRMA